MDERSFGYQGGMHMHIERLKTGMIEENCYLVYNEEALLIPYPLRSYRCSRTITRVLSNPSLCQPTRAKMAR